MEIMGFTPEAEGSRTVHRVQVASFQASPSGLVAEILREPPSGRCLGYEMKRAPAARNPSPRIHRLRESIE